MKVMAQVAMVMNLDKCIGCHTCSVTCKQAWTNRAGTEYVWFNNVETKPGVGYPRGYEDKEKWQGGWVRTASGKLRPRAGGRLKKLATIFSNPRMPLMEDYYEPWTYEYDNLLAAPKDSKNLPTARPRSQISGKPMDTIAWSAAWDDSLGGSPETMQEDPILKKMSEKVTAEIEQAFMFYLPRICEHCLNPTCVASCPSGAMYKRFEDGIVLVDQDKCRGWRMCVSGCPYKKVYFNHVTGKAEKCTLCYPRLEVGQPTVCSETCVGRLRYLGVLLYDADRVVEQHTEVTEPPDARFGAHGRLPHLEPGVAECALLGLAGDVVEVDLLVGAPGDAHAPATALVLVDENDAVLEPFVHRPGRARGHAGGVQAVLADARQVEHEGLLDLGRHLLAHLLEDRVLLHRLRRPTQRVVPGGRPRDGVHGLARDLRARAGRGQILRVLGRGEQVVVLVRPGLVVVLHERHARVGEDGRELLEAPAGPRSQLPGCGPDPPALPLLLVLVPAGVAHPGFRLHVVEPDVLGAGPVGPCLLARDRTGVAADALVEVHDNRDLRHDLHQNSTSWLRRRITVTSSRWF